MRSSACYPRDFGRFVASQHIKVMDSCRSTNIVGEVPHFVVHVHIPLGWLPFPPARFRQIHNCYSNLGNCVFNKTCKNT